MSRNFIFFEIDVSEKSVTNALPKSQKMSKVLFRFVKILCIGQKSSKHAFYVFSQTVKFERKRIKIISILS